MNGVGPLTATCPVCGHTMADIFLCKGRYRIVRCQQCHTLYVHPMPSQGELRAHYEDPQYFEGPSDQGYSNYARMRKVLVPLAEKRLAAIERLVSVPAWLLDFGCAAGYFLEVARKQGWGISGIELASAMAQQASERLGIPIYDTLDALPDRDLDAITLWEVIEHLPSPVDTLQRLRARMRPGGILMLSTPNAGHWRAQSDPQRWAGYCPPSHLVFFTTETLYETLRQAGFREIRIRSVAPLPRLPDWLCGITRPLEKALASGEARPWLLALGAWRMIRLFAWAWRSLFGPREDLFATLEAQAVSPR